MGISQEKGFPNKRKYREKVEGGGGYWSKSIKLKFFRAQIKKKIMCYELTKFQKK